MFRRRKKEQDRLEAVLAAMSPEERRDARTAAVFHQALRGRVHLMTMLPDIEYYYFELMHPVGESLGVDVAICPSEPPRPDVPRKMGYEFRTMARKATYDARVVIGWRHNFERDLHRNAAELLVPSGRPTTATTIASGVIAMVEDDHNVFETYILASAMTRAVYALYDEVIVLRGGSVTYWPTEW